MNKDQALAMLKLIADLYQIINLDEAPPVAPHETEHLSNGREPAVVTP